MQRRAGVCTSGPPVRPAMNRRSIAQRRMNAALPCANQARFSGRCPIARGIHPRADVCAPLFAFSYCIG